MASGALAQLTLVEGRGGRGWERSVHGRWGALYAPGERNGQAVLLRLEGKELKGKEILSLLPDFHLDEMTERLFGADGVEYEMPTDVPHPGYAIDARHLAIEYHDFGRAILTGGQPELDGLGGAKAVAAILGAYESAVAGRSLTMEEVLTGQVRAYQEEIDEKLGLN
jgi:predicted dehydrogenase